MWPFYLHYMYDIYIILKAFYFSYHCILFEEIWFFLLLQSEWILIPIGILHLGGIWVKTVSCGLLFKLEKDIYTTLKSIYYSLQYFYLKKNSIRDAHTPQPLRTVR